MVVAPVEPMPVVAVAARVDEAQVPTYAALVRDRRHRDARAKRQDDQRGVGPETAAGDRQRVPPAASARREVPHGLVLGALARATAGREPPSPIATHQPVGASQGLVEMRALEPGDDRSRGVTTAMDAEAHRRGATHRDVIHARRRWLMASALADTTRRAHQRVEIPMIAPAARAPVPAEPVAGDRAAATGYRHDASKHPGVPRRSAPPR